MSDHSNDLVLVEHRDGCHVVRFLTESLFDPLIVSQVDKELHAVVSDAVAPKLVLTLDTIDHVASATISTVISLRSACQGKGGDIALAAVPKTILEILKIARLDSVFRIYDTPDQAIEALTS
jgi:anti-anti-sigma factor